MVFIKHLDWLHSKFFINVSCNYFCMNVDLNRFVKIDLET